MNKEPIIKADTERLLTMALAVALIVAGKILGDTEMRSTGLLMLGVASPWPGDIIRGIKLRRENEEKAEALKEASAAIPAPAKARLSKRTRESMAEVSAEPAKPITPPEAP
jgi:hypothetical protein